MKKIFILLSVLCLYLIAPTNAQPDSTRRHFADIPNRDNGEGKRINVGLSFAQTINWMLPNTKNKNDLKRDGITTGFRLGIPVNINLNKGKNYYILTGLFYEQIGGKLTFRGQLPDIFHDDTAARCYRRYEANYLTIPVGITLKSKSIHNFYICGNVGFYNSFRMKSYNYDSYLINDELWTRGKALSKKGEVAIFRESVFVGLGIEYSITQNFRTGIYVNYSHTLTNYTKVPDKTKIGCLELTLNINFF